LTNPEVNYTVSILFDYNQPNVIRMPTVPEHMACLTVPDAYGCTPDNPKRPRDIYRKPKVTKEQKSHSPSLATIVISMTMLTVASGLFACATSSRCKDKVKDKYQQ